MSSTPSAERPFAVTATRYASAAAAARAFERVMVQFRRFEGSGDSAYRFSLDGENFVAVLSWRPTPERLAAVAALPWGDGEPAPIPSSIAEQLAVRSLQAAPSGRGRMRRVYRDPSGRVLSDREVSDD